MADLKEWGVCVTPCLNGEEQKETSEMLKAAFGDKMGEERNLLTGFQSRKMVGLQSTMPNSQGFPLSSIADKSVEWEVNAVSWMLRIQFVSLERSENQSQHALDCCHIHALPTKWGEKED